MNGSSGSRFIAFDAFVLDRQTRELTKDGVPLRLSEQPFLVLECLLEHRGEVVTRDELRKRVWPTDTFVDFEHGLNAVVKRLRDALGDAADAPRFIETVPRRGYRFVALAVPPAAPVMATAEARRRPALWPALGFALATLAVAMTVWGWRRAPSAGSEPPHSVRLTALEGLEHWPTLSPDGMGVAFGWSAKDTPGTRIYTAPVGVPGDPRRLTNGPGEDNFPAWSPDGRRIAFVRFPVERNPPQGFVHVVTPLAGTESKLSDFAVFGPLSWSPDSRYIAVNRQPPTYASGKTGIFLLPSAGGEPVQFTPTAAPAFDVMPAFSPDGHRLAFASCKVFGVCDVYTVDLDGRSLPVAPPRRLTPQSVFFVWGIAWSPDGADVLYAVQGAWLTWIWRVRGDGSGQPVRVELPGAGARMPVTTHVRGTLAFARWEVNVDIHRFDRHGTGGPVIASTLADFQPALSPDDRHMVFISEQSSDTIDLFVSNVDGSGAHRLLRGPGRFQGSPRWSPDGGRIVFNSTDAEGRVHVWSVDAQGGTPSQITNGPENEGSQTWSRDGRWIYFSAGKVPGGPGDLWRVRADGGAPEQVVKGVGSFAEESMDGRDLVYQPSGGDSALMARPIAGGAARQLLPCVRNAGFAVTRHGIFYVTCDTAANAVRLFDPATGRDQAIGTLTDLVGGGIAVTADGRSIYYSRGGGARSDLMAIEHFK
jgi:Tol biopolymer transport system component/DNA-binding winged helix-turn-helix (wHTH) protein